MSGAAAALLLTVSVLVHWPFGIAEFVLDDHDFVVLNASIRSFSGAWDTLLEPFPPDQPERGLYRPVTSLSYAIDYAFSGEDARGYHRTNVALYLVVVLLVYRLALTYLATPSFAVAVALVFSLHPVHTGAVDAIAGRSELLALLFGLTSILLFLRAVRSAGSPLWALGGSLLAYALAGLSKETGVVLPGVLAFHVLLFHPPRAKGDQARRDRALRFLAPFAFVLAAYLALRLSVLGRFSPELMALDGEPLVVRLLTMGSVFFENLRLLVYPSVLHVDYYYHDTIGIVSEPSARAILGLAAAALCLALLAAALVRHLRGAPEEAQGDARTRAVAILSLATFAIFLFPVSHVFNINAILAERFLLAPSLGFILLVVLAGRHLLRSGGARSTETQTGVRADAGCIRRARRLAVCGARCRMARQRSPMAGHGPRNPRKQPDPLGPRRGLPPAGRVHAGAGGARARPGTGSRECVGCQQPWRGPDAARGQRGGGRYLPTHTRRASG